MVPENSAASQSFMQGLRRRNPRQDEFIQAVCEVARSMFPLIEDNADDKKPKVLERMTEPDRMIVFRVSCFSELPGIIAKRHRLERRT